MSPKATVDGGATPSEGHVPKVHCRTGVPPEQGMCPQTPLQDRGATLSKGRVPKVHYRTGVPPEQGMRPKSPEAHLPMRQTVTLYIRGVLQ